jgi:hypothetical protein
MKKTQVAVAAAAATAAMEESHSETVRAQP